MNFRHLLGCDTIVSMGSASRRQLRSSSRRGKWGFSSKDRKESNSTEARTENGGGMY